MLNNVVLVGRLVADPELKEVGKEGKVVNFTVAVSRSYKNAEGEYEADFINCVAYKHQAETIAKYIKKGDRLGIEARIQTRSYENQEGKTIRLTEAIIEHMDFIEGKKAEEKPQEEPKTESDPFLDFGESISIDEDNLPF